MTKEYKVYSKVHGEQVILLDDEDFARITENNIKTVVHTDI